MAISVMFSVFFSPKRELKMIKDTSEQHHSLNRLLFEQFSGFFFLNKLIYCNYIAAQSGWREGHGRGRVLLAVPLLDLKFFWKWCLEDV